MIFLSIVSMVVTTALLVLIVWANMMSDAPDVQVSLWPAAIIGYGVAGAFLAAWWFG